MPFGSHTRPSAELRLARWLGCCVVLLLSLMARPAAAFAVAPMCDSTASSVNAPLPAPPTSDGEIQACDFNTPSFVEPPQQAPEDRPRSSPKFEREPAVCREALMGAPAIGFSRVPLPRAREVLATVLPEHRWAPERPPRS